MTWICFEALSREMEFVLKGFQQTGPSRFIGGGSDSPGRNSLRVAGSCRRCIQPGNTEMEYRKSSGYITPEVADVLRIAGVDRVTLGMQSGQSYSIASGGGSASCIVEGGRNTGMRSVHRRDLILGLPGEKIVNFRAGLEKRLRPSHISAYMLSIEEGTPW